MCMHADVTAAMMQRRVAGRFFQTFFSSIFLLFSLGVAFASSRHDRCVKQAHFLWGIPCMTAGPNTFEANLRSEVPTLIKQALCFLNSSSDKLRRWEHLKWITQAEDHSHHCEELTVNFVWLFHGNSSAIWKSSQVYCVRKQFEACTNA